MNHYIEMWRRILQFEGRANREAFWWPTLINIAAGLVISLIFSWSIPLVVTVYEVALIIATFTLTCRRLRDAGFDWWWALLRFASLIGLPFSTILSLVPLIMCAMPTKNPNVIDV